MDTNCHYRIGFHQPMPSIKISIFRMQDPGLVEANDCIITTNTSHNSESSENLNNFLRIMERLNPGLLDSKALYNNASQMARQQMGHFCMICLDYIPTYLEYLGNWSPLIFIHTPSHTLSLPSPPPKPLRQFSFEGTHFLKLSQSILWIHEENPTILGPPARSYLLTAPSCSLLSLKAAFHLFRF